MDTLLISLHPRHCQNILAGNKTIELRKRSPKAIKPVFFPGNKQGLIPKFTQILMYETNPTAAIVGLTTPTEILEHTCSEWHEFTSELCLSVSEIEEYLGGYCGWGIKVENPQLITPIPLSKMRDLNITPPQGYRYLSDELVEQLLA
jgi:predicted transcriptional regulator